MPHRELKQRVSESRAKRVWTLPNRWSSESHQACLNGRVATEVGVANVSCFNRRLNNANAVKRMTDLFAFGEFWRRLSHLGKFNTCQWHSACTKFGHSSTSEATSSITNNFATLSLSQVLTYNKLSTVSPLVGALIYGFSCIRAREAALFFTPVQAMNF